MLKKYVVKFLVWLLGSYLVPRVRELIKEYESVDVTGNRKRDQVVNRTLETFPDAKRRDIGLLIELLLQED